MWRGYEVALALYQNWTIYEWISRGYKNNMPYFPITTTVILPPWLGNKKFHRSHQSKLLYKNRDHYLKYFGDIPDDLNYRWYVDHEWYET